MSRNLSADHCVECGHGPVTLADICGKAVELRGYHKYVPQIGVRWDCPECGTAYFANYRTRGDCVGCAIAGVYPADGAGTWEIDLSYWSSYNDEVSGSDGLRGLVWPPRHLVTEGREDQRFALGNGFSGYYQKDADDTAV